MSDRGLYYTKLLLLDKIRKKLTIEDKVQIFLQGYGWDILYNNPEVSFYILRKMKYKPHLFDDSIYEKIDKKRLLKSLSKSASKSYNYAKYVLKDRFPEGEPAIFNDPYITYLYARYIVKQTDEKVEDALLNGAPCLCYWYAKDVLKSRFKKAEKYILVNDCDIGLQYILHFNLGRCRSIEPELVKVKGELLSKYILYLKKTNIHSYSNFLNEYNFS